MKKKGGILGGGLLFLFIYFLSIRYISPPLLMTYPKVTYTANPSDLRKEPVQRCQGYLRCEAYISLLLGSGDDGGVISHPTAVTKCSFCWVFHEVKLRWR